MQAADLARNRWPALLVHFGIERHLLTGKHTPCPACGGRDRFRFDDKGGRGTWICSKCGSGDGFALLGMVKGWRFREAAIEVERIAGYFQPGKVVPPERSAADKIEACRRIWRESQPVKVGDPVQTYLRRRTGVEQVPACIRFHLNLPYRHDDGTITRHPAMISKVQDANELGCAIHRTYLSACGAKADVPSPKKIAGSLPPGAAIRLSAPGGTIGIAEGIETALSASAHFGIPVWSAISSNGLELWTPPAGTACVVIFGDNDLSGTGQAAAWSLAKRLISAGIQAEVRIPELPGEDWNDTLTNRRSFADSGCKERLPYEPSSKG